MLGRLKLPSRKERLFLPLCEKETYPAEVVASDTSGELSTDTIYMLMTRAVAKGYLAAREETEEEKQESKRPGPLRTYYRLTSYGKEMLQMADNLEKSLKRVARLKPEGAV